MTDKTNNAQKVRIAWYENNRDFIIPIMFYLKKFNFEVHIVDSHDNAEVEFQRLRPDIIIFDYRMPVVGGLEMYKTLEKEKMNDKFDFDFIPIFSTIWAKDDSTRQELEDAGIDPEAIFSKQIDPESFAKNLKSYYHDFCE